MKSPEPETVRKWFSLGFPCHVFGDAITATGAERIVNRSSAGIGWPAGMRRTDWFLPLFFGLIGIGYLAGIPRGTTWFGWFYLTLAGFSALTIWQSSIAWMEVDPGSLRVRFNGRSRVIPLSEVVNVEAHRHWHNPLTPRREPAYYLILRRPSRRAWPRRGWLLQYIAPEAGDRLLAALHRFQKPITVYDWK